jgi:hypothetical protein
MKINELFTDDMINDLSDLGGSDLSPSITPRSHSQKRYEPREYPGTKPSSHTKYIRSIQELKEVLEQLLGNDDVSLKNVVRLFADHNYAIDERVDLMLPTKDLYTVREWDRKMIDGNTGKNSQEEMDDLIADIKQNGIQSKSIITIARTNQYGDVSVILGEGNHRLSIAIELGISSMPVRFHYRR